jgi:carboxylate-amine ligase
LEYAKQVEVPVRDLIVELLEFVDDVVDELGSRKELQHIHKILAERFIANQQLKVYQDSDGNLRTMMGGLMKEASESVF